MAGQITKSPRKLDFHLIRFRIFIAEETPPSMVTLEAICKAFNITMAQFFAEDDMVELTPELRKLFDRWTALTDEQKAALWQIKKTYE